MYLTTACFYFVMPFAVKINQIKSNQRMSFGMMTKAKRVPIEGPKITTTGT